MADDLESQYHEAVHSRDKNSNTPEGLIAWISKWWVLEKILYILHPSRFPDAGIPSYARGNEWAHLRNKKITKEQALEIAKVHCNSRFVRLELIENPEKLVIYGARHFDFKVIWCFSVSINDVNSHILNGPTRALFISSETGEIIFDGSVNSGE